VRFGCDRVMEVISANARNSAQEIVNAVCDALFDFGHGRVTDDVALVIIKVL